MAGSSKEVTPRRTREHDLFVLFLNESLSCDDEDFFHLLNAYESQTMIVVIPPQSFVLPRGFARYRVLTILRLASSSFTRSRRQWQAQGKDIFRSVRPVKDLWARVEVYEAFLAYVTEDVESAIACSCLASLTRRLWG